MRFLTLIMTVLLVGETGCEDCPDRTTEIAISPTSLSRVAPTMLTVAFPSDVFVEAQPAVMFGMQLTLSGPRESSPEQVVDEWTGEGPSDAGFIRDVRVLDRRSLALVVAPDPSVVSGTYRLRVMADTAGACSGSNGTRDVTVP